MENEIKVDDASQEMSYYNSHTTYIEWDDFKALYERLHKTNIDEGGKIDGEDFTLFKDKRNNAATIYYSGWVYVYRPKSDPTKTFGKRIMEIEGL